MNADQRIKLMVGSLIIENNLLTDQVAALQLQLDRVKAEYANIAAASAELKTANANAGEAIDVEKA